MLTNEPALILYAGRRQVTRTRLRSELGSRLGKPIDLAIRCSSSSVSVAVLWSDLGITFFEQPSLSSPFEESSCMQLPASAVRITTQVTVDDRLLVFTADAQVWVFDWVRPDLRSHLPQGRRIALPWAHPHPLMGVEYDSTLQAIVAVTTDAANIVVCSPVTQEQVRSWVDQGEGRPAAQQFPCRLVESPLGVSCVALNASDRTVIVGHADGSLSTLALGSGHMEPIAMSDWRHPGSGPVSCIAVDGSGSAFAVGWARCGLAVLSTGTWARLYCSWTLHDSARASVDVAHDGCAHVDIRQWSLSYADRHGLHTMALVRAQERCHRHLVLFGRDRIHLWSSGESTLARVVPPEYPLGRDGVRLATISDSGRQLAVAGPRGVAVFNDLLQRWRWTAPTCAYRCRALRWFGEYVLVAGTDDHVLMMPRQDLSDTGQLVSFPVSGPVASIDMDPYAGLLLVSLGDGLQQLYAVRARFPDRVYPPPLGGHIAGADLARLRIQCHLVRQMRLPHAPSIDLQLAWQYMEETPGPADAADGAGAAGDRGRRRLSWVWPWASAVPSAPAHRLPPGLAVGILQLTRDRRLLIRTFPASDQDGDDASDDVVFLCDNVERFWVGPIHEGDHENRLLWTYSSGAGAQIWLPSSGALPRGLAMTGRLTPLSVFGVSRDVQPVGVAARVGMILAVRQGRLPTGCASLQIKQESYLHVVLLHEIVLGRDALARDMVDRFQDSPFLLHALEMLLHASMEADTQDGKRSTAVDLVLKFVRRYPLYLQVVVRCARKTDFSHWGRLFPLAGVPLALFEECLQRGDLASASHYLLVLQRTEGSLIAHQNAVRLLDALTSTELTPRTMRIAVQLMRFLQMSRARNCSNYDTGAELQRRVSDATLSDSAAPSSSLSSTVTSPRMLLPERRPSAVDLMPLPVRPDAVHADAKAPDGWIDGILSWFIQ
ncbi:Ribosome control protein 1 domain-containing protein [Plasmodiophora brassicae]